jgi:hypothetical protein
MRSTPSRPRRPSSTRGCITLPTTDLDADVDASVEVDLAEELTELHDLPDRPVVEAAGRAVQPLVPTILQTTKPGGAGWGTCSISGGALLASSHEVANRARMSARVGELELSVGGGTGCAGMTNSWFAIRACPPPRRDLVMFF